jgi:hypothetical protein
MKKLNLQKIREAIKGGFRPSRTLKNLGFGAKPQEHLTDDYTIKKKTIYELCYKQKRIPIIQCRWGLIQPNLKQIHEFNKITRKEDRILTQYKNQKSKSLIRKFKNYEISIN